MSSDYIMTMQQAQMEMELYKKVFTVVRLLDKREFRLEENDNPGGDMELCHCYDFWKKEKPCKNCIAARAFEEKSVRTKLEYLDSDIYQVTACYVEIDGQPYVMELLRKMDEEFLVDLENRDRLMDKLSGYNEKLYQDALTGVYNRRYYEDRIKKMTASVGVAMIDMDDFKIYNDTYGHNAGDLALITTVEAIRRCIRKNTVVTEKDFANEEGEDGTALEALKVKQQILIVDDSEMNREILTEVLQNGECGAFNPVLLECLTDIQDHLKEVVNSDFVDNFDAEDNPELAGSHRSETENISVGETVRKLG